MLNWSRINHLKSVKDFSVYINSKCEPIKMTSTEFFESGHNI